ncbi:C-type lectin lectoxin-Lio3-like [Babylonia areolata]|uniref:C-type lectin lectoxin-Lio3-like n=1 Tax=Babylonia areolata TaxID=304850 RepID=UPI003FD48DAD
MLRLFVFLGVVASVYTAISTNDCPANLPRNRYLRAFGNSCYLFVLDHMREFDNAEKECEARGGHLAIIRDIATQNFLYHTLRQDFHYDDIVWIGLSDERSEGHWVWVDGSAARFTYWASDQPGILGSLEDCVAMDVSDGGRWHDYKCTDLLFISHHQTFVCEYPVWRHTTPMRTTSTPATTTTTTKPPTTTTPQPTTLPPTTLPPTTLPPTTPMPPTTTVPPTTVPPTTTTQPTTQPPTTTTREHTTPAATTASSDGGCPTFDCSLDCGLSGYMVDDNNCLMCQCEE